MDLQIGKTTILILLVLCIASFGWGMRSFFRQPYGSNRGLTVVKYAGLAAALANVVGIVKAPERDWLSWAVCAILYLSSLSLFWWAVRENSRQPLTAVFSPDAPSHLVTTGPYRLVRHPFYCSYLITWLAGWPASGSLWLLLIFVVMAVLYKRAADFEERKFASSEFRDAYMVYASKTGQLIPKP